MIFSIINSKDGWFNGKIHFTITNEHRWTLPVIQSEERRLPGDWAIPYYYWLYQSYCSIPWCITIVGDITSIIFYLIFLYIPIILKVVNLVIYNIYNWLIWYYIYHIYIYMIYIYIIYDIWYMIYIYIIYIWYMICIYIYYIIYIHIRFPYFHCYPASSPLHKLLPVSGASSPQLFGSTVTKRCWAETEIAVVAGRWSG